MHYVHLPDFVALLTRINVENTLSLAIVENEQVFENIPMGEAGIVLLVLFLCVMNIMLLNLLIAIMATAHSRVQLNADKEAMLSKALIITRYRCDSGWVLKHGGISWHDASYPTRV